MIIYKGKYPKRINSIYSLKSIEGRSSGYGATLNDGTLIKFHTPATLKWATGYEPDPATYTVVGQSKNRKAFGTPACAGQTGFDYNGKLYLTQDAAKEQLIKDIGNEDLVSVDDENGIYRTASTTYTIERA